MVQGCEILLHLVELSWGNGNDVMHMSKNLWSALVDDVKYGSLGEGWLNGSLGLAYERALKGALVW